MQGTGVVVFSTQMGLDGNGINRITKVLETANVVAFNAAGIEAIEVIDAEFCVGLTGAQNVIGGVEDAVRDSDRGLGSGRGIWRFDGTACRGSWPWT